MNALTVGAPGREKVERQCELAGGARQRYVVPTFSFGFAHATESRHRDAKRSFSAHEIDRLPFASTKHLI